MDCFKPTLVSQLDDIDNEDGHCRDNPMTRMKILGYLIRKEVQRKDYLSDD